MQKVTILVLGRIDVLWRKHRNKNDDIRGPKMSRQTPQSLHRERVKGPSYFSGNSERNPLFLQYAYFFQKVISLINHLVVIYTLEQILTFQWCPVNTTLKEEFQQEPLKERSNFSKQILILKLCHSLPVQGGNYVVGDQDFQLLEADAFSSWIYPQ